MDAEQASAASRGRAKLDEFRRKKQGGGRAGGWPSASLSGQESATERPSPSLAPRPAVTMPVPSAPVVEAPVAVPQPVKLPALPLAAPSGHAAGYSSLSDSYFLTDDPPLPPLSSFLAPAATPGAECRVPQEPQSAPSVLSWLQAPTHLAPGLAPPAASPPAPAEETSPAPPPPPPPHASTHDLLACHIDALTADKLLLARQLEKAMAVTAALAQENDHLAARFNAQAVQLEVSSAALEFALVNAEGRAASSEAAAAANDKARAQAASALARCGALAADAISLEERLLATRSRELQALERADALARAAAQAARQADVAGRAARSEARQKRRLLRRLRLLAAERELARLPPLPAGFFTQRSAESSSDSESQSEDEQTQQQAQQGSPGLQPSTPPSSPPAQPPRDASTSFAAPPNTPIVAEPALCQDGAAMLHRIHAMLGELERCSQAGPPRAAATADELAAANAELSRRLAAAQAALERAGLSEEVAFSSPQYRIRS